MLPRRTRSRVPQASLLGIRDVTCTVFEPVAGARCAQLSCEELLLRWEAAWRARVAGGAPSRKRSVARALLLLHGLASAAACLAAALHAASALAAPVVFRSTMARREAQDERWKEVCAPAESPTQCASAQLLSHAMLCHPSMRWGSYRSRSFRNFVCV